MRHLAAPGRLRVGLGLLAALPAWALAAGCGAKAVRDDAPPPAAAPRDVRPALVTATLDNGLRVYMVEDRTAPLVSYQVWFEVGSVDEREAGPGEGHGITGLSHFFEHMMFRGTERFPAFFDAIYAMGGKLNAFTWLDETVYWENVPSQHLRKVIAMEADRLEHMEVDFLNLEPEREVVKSERLLRTENRPEGLAWEVLQSRVFTSFPYHWGTIGWMRDLNRITVEEAQAYHTVHYAPNNAYVIVAGDHDPQQTLAWIREAYGHLPPREVPAEDFPPEPPQTEERRDRVYKAADPPVVMWAWRAPAVRDRDFAVLEVLDRLLVGAKSSRLQQRLVHARPPRLGRLYAYLFPIRYPYMYLFGANLQEGMTVRELEAVVDEEIGRLVRDGVSDDELRRAVAQLRGDLVRQNLSNQEKAEFLGFSLRATDDPYTFFDRLEVYGEITSADVQRVAAELLRPEAGTWVPVVDPGRFAALAGAVAEAAGGALPAGLADVATGAVDALLERRKLDEKAASLDLEQEALAHLELRAQRAREGADEATRAAIDQYLADNENGLAKRTARLEAARGALAAERAALAAKEKALVAGWKKVARKRAAVEAGPGRWLFALARNALRPDRAAPLALLPAPGDGAPAADVAQQAAWEAIMSLLRERLGHARSAQEHRERAIALADRAAAALAAEDPWRAVAEAAGALAWDTQVTGMALEDADVLAVPTGTRGGAR